MAVKRFTFHHVSIKTVTVTPSSATLSVFTFHHVSIKTDWKSRMCLADLIFTFHHVSIKTAEQKASMHSRMIYLHSTMYLLKRMRLIRRPMWITFTFHHVSIKTGITGKPFQRYINLHSTMYLLKRKIWKTLSEVIRIYIPPCIY